MMPAKRVGRKVWSKRRLTGIDLYRFKVGEHADMKEGLRRWQLAETGGILRSTRTSKVTGYRA